MPIELSSQRSASARRLLSSLSAECGSREATYWQFEEPDRLRALLNVGPNPERLEDLSVPLEGSLIGMVATTCMAAAMGREAPYHPAADAATGVRTDAMAAAPVLVDGTLVGVLSTINPRGGGEFTEADVDRVQGHALLLGCLLERWSRE